MTQKDLLIANPTKAKTKLGWECKYDLPALVKEMIIKVKLMQGSPVFESCDAF